MDREYKGDGPVTVIEHPRKRNAGFLSSAQIDSVLPDFRLAPRGHHAQVSVEARTPNGSVIPASFQATQMPHEVVRLDALRGENTNALATKAHMK